MPHAVALCHPRSSACICGYAFSGIRRKPRTTQMDAEGGQGLTHASAFCHLRLSACICGYAFSGVQRKPQTTRMDADEERPGVKNARAATAAYISRFLLNVNPRAP